MLMRVRSHSSDQARAVQTRRARSRHGRHQTRRAANGKGPLRGLSFSGPISRILSRATICLIEKGGLDGPPKRSCSPPGPRRAGSTVLLGFAPGGVYLAAASPRRRCALTAPFHLCLYATHVWPRHRPYISAALSRGFPRVGVTHRHALWCPDFPRGVFSPPAVAWPALRGYPLLHGVKRIEDVGAWRAARTRATEGRRVVHCLTRRAKQIKDAGSVAAERTRASEDAELLGPAGQETLRKTPITLPSTVASVVLIGFMERFSGCRRT